MNADLPEGYAPGRLLSRSERSEVWLLERDGAPQVVRIGARVPSELAVYARVRHPAIVAPTATGRTPAGRPWVARPFIEGRPLDVALSSAAVGERPGLVGAVLAALGAIHEAGLLHRDVKASNILVGERGVSLVDLDLVVTGASGAAAGSPAHLAPELLMGGRATVASDLFALGATLAWALAGPPDAALHERFPRLPFWEAAGIDPARIDAGLAPLVRALVARRPDARPISARAAARLLGSAADEPPPTELPFLAGRDGALHDLVQATAPGGRVVLVALAHAEEAAALVDVMQIERARRGAPPARIAASTRVDGPERAATGTFDEAWEALTQPASGPSLLMPLAAEQAALLGTELRARLSAAEAARLVEVPWPGVPVEFLEGHLSRIADDSSPDVAARLARDLHRRTAGRRRDLDELLRTAVRDGALRRAGGHYELLRETWPDTPLLHEAGAARLATLQPPARRALEVLCCLDLPAERGVVAACVRLSADALAEAEAALIRVGALRIEGSSGAWDVEDRRWLDAARAARSTAPPRRLSPSRASRRSPWPASVSPPPRAPKNSPRCCGPPRPSGAPAASPRRARSCRIWRHARTNSPRRWPRNSSRSRRVSTSPRDMPAAPCSDCTNAAGAT